MRHWPLFPILLTFLIGSSFFVRPSMADEKIDVPNIDRNAARIDKLPPDTRGGQAYRLVYRVDVPIDVLWRFKTDFSNPVFLTNKFISTHRLIRRTATMAVTAIEYAQRPKIEFQWQTHLLPLKYRLEFQLLNPEQCQQRFHYGYIQLQDRGNQTLVTHVAYFDFWGAFLWANYPWRGGMASFLRYMARWEQETVPFEMQHDHR